MATTSSLQTIQQKVRRLTRSPSESQLSTNDLNQYINTFVLYDFPEHLRLFNFRTTFTFYTQPGVDQYATTTTDVNSALYNFKNKYIAVHPPVFLAGIQGFFTQWRDVFYGYYPQTATIAMTGLVGTGSTGPFIGNIMASPSVQRSINFNCLDTSGTAMVLTDIPTDNIMGNLVLENYATGFASVYGTINYITGAYNFEFPNNTLVAAPIWVENLAYQPGKPLAVLYYDDTFTIRPVPDKVYAVEFEVDVQPTEFLGTNPNQNPDLNQFWQYIAYGTAKKIFEDKMDLESVNLIMPEFKQQERLVLRTTLTQQANERTVTIYTQGKNYGFGWFGPGGWPY